MIDWIIGGVLALIAMAFVLYWQLAIAEGAYLGRHVVALLYNWFAPRYDQVKQFRPALDSVMLATPIMKHLSQRAGAGVTIPQVLDVATGTGRMPQTLLVQKNFTGNITALDISERMLAIGRAKLSAYADRITWLQHDAQHLPFDDAHFDVVTSLEALEFLPHPRKALLEMVRVLRPGGMLIVTNRIGPDAWKMPGRTQTTGALAAWLEQQGLHDVQPDTWLVDYDLVRAVK